MGVAIASPLVNPQSFEVICSGTGAIKLLVHPACVYATGWSFMAIGVAFASRRCHAKVIFREMGGSEKSGAAHSFVVSPAAWEKAIVRAIAFSLVS